ncbi:hypothetical protein EAH74_31655 [Pseudomonas mandelii]|uniref:Uncharacterized protein n=1 Tax=Pseudomonas mandelii TaxID=75612 RepID=A0A502HJ89_9PSED|nr:hypothetical protein EAH74_31655 [Pseudomonas mandelii]
MHSIPLMPGTRPVGASLLAKAASHPTLLVTDTPLSRAGSLPLRVGVWQMDFLLTSVILNP